MKVVLGIIILCTVGIQTYYGQVRQFRNTKSELDFALTNTGILFSDTAQPGLFWPRGSKDGYMFGGGFWFGAKKRIPLPPGSDAWGLAGSVDDSLIAICGNPATHTLVLGTWNDSAYVRSDMDKDWHKISLPAKKYLIFSVGMLPSGNQLIGTDSGLFIGKDGGTWIAAPGIIGQQLGAVSAYGAVASRSKRPPTSFNVFIPDSTFSSWKLCRTTTTNVSPYSLIIGSSKDNKVIAVSNNVFVLTSTDFGVTWDSTTTKPSTAPIRGIGISPIDGSIFIASDSIYQSNDRGLHWVTRTIGMTGGPILAFKVGASGFVAATRDGLYVLPIDSMSKGGWENRSLGLPAVRIVAVDLDPTGKLHVILADRSIYTQYKGNEFQSGEIPVCELSYDANSATGWFAPGELGVQKEAADSMGKYLPYLSTSFDKKNGLPFKSDSITPTYRWPIWISEPNTAKTNFRFGTMTSTISDREAASLSSSKPAFISDEDIITTYNDADTANPLFLKGSQYTLGLSVEQRVFSWEFGKYRDVVFIRYKFNNTSSDTLKECFFAPALDPDLGGGGGASNDYNSAITIADSVMVRRALGSAAELQEFADNPAALNMAYQWSDPEGGKEYGVIGFALVETPIVSGGRVISPDDSIGLGGYGSGSSYPGNQLGLHTFRSWTINNDPQDNGTRYSFISSGLHDHSGGIKGDLRALLSTGPFDLLPGASATVTLAVGIARPSTVNRQTNIDSLISLMAHAHRFFASQEIQPGTGGTIIRNFGGSPDQDVNRNTGASNINLTMYPNPLSSVGILHYTLPQYSTVSVKIFTEIGQNILTPYEEQKEEAGEHKLPIDLSPLPNGHYNCIVTCNGKSTTVSIILSK